MRMLDFCLDALINSLSKYNKDSLLSPETVDCEGITLDLALERYAEQELSNITLLMFGEDLMGTYDFLFKHMMGDQGSSVECPSPPDYFGKVCIGLSSMNHFLFRHCVLVFRREGRPLLLENISEDLRISERYYSDLFVKHLMENK